MHQTNGVGKGMNRKILKLIATLGVVTAPIAANVAHAELLYSAAEGGGYAANPSYFTLASLPNTITVGFCPLSVVSCGVGGPTTVQNLSSIPFILKGNSGTLDLSLNASSGPLFDTIAGLFDGQSVLAVGISYGNLSASGVKSTSYFSEDFILPNLSSNKGDRISSIDINSSFNYSNPADPARDWSAVYQAKVTACASARNCPYAPTVSAPEIDPTSAASGLTLLIGGLVVMRGKKKSTCLGR
jgi:hypothetical protein